MLAITITINIIWIPLIALISVVIGYAYRSNQISKLNNQISSLEREMLNSHAEILTLQQELVQIQNKSSNSKSLVVSMKEVPTEEEKEKNSDLANRKKVNS
jgi:hypothetical protein